MRSPLRAMAAALDDAALEALAPKGLIRRAMADVAEGRVAVTREDDRSAEVAADGQTVRVLATGPRAATCDCPAPGVCRHALSALIVLRDAPGPATPDSPEAEPAPPDWSALATDFTADRLSRFAGKAGWRDVLARAESARTAEVLQLVDTLQVRLAPGDDPVVFMAHGGLEAALCRVPDKSRKARIALAALAVRHALGMAELDTAAPGTDAAASPAVVFDDRILPAVQDLLRRLFRAALAFAPRALEEEVRRMALAGRVESLPRLGGMLRRIADGLAAVRARNADADPDALLETIAETYALTVALSAAGASGNRATLAGSARQTYTPIGDLELFGLGAQRWEAGGGARGVTAYLHHPASGCSFSISHARADGADPTFDPLDAFEHSPVWTVSLRALSTGSAAVRNASASADGRLSMGRETSASVTTWTPNAKAVRDWPCAFDDWAQLQESLRQTFSPALTAPRPPRQPVVLMQARFAPLRFDELSQTLIWPVADQAGRWIALALPYTGLHSARVEALERVGKSGSFWAILATAEPSGGRLDIRPYAVWSDRLHLLDFESDSPAWTPKAGSGLLQRLLSQKIRHDRSEPVLHAGGDATARLIDEAWGLLLHHAEMGQGASPGTMSKRAGDLAGRLEHAGLAPLARPMARLAGDPSGEAGLAATWALGCARRSRAALAWMR